MDLDRYANELAANARRAGLALAAEPAARRTAAIRAIAAKLRACANELVAANARDLAAGEAAGLAAPTLKRLMLDAARVERMAVAIDEIAAQPDPIGTVIDSHVRKDGLKIEKIRVPVGSVLFIYESRPNVTTDAAALCLRSGNAVILRGGKEAFHSNQLLAEVISAALAEARLDANSVQVVSTTDRALLPIILKKSAQIDVVIPRGGESLIRAVTEASTIPVLKHFDGNCHIYLDKASPEPKQVVDVIVNAKTSYPGGAVCNAVEHVLVHRDSAAQIPAIVKALRDKGVEVRGDDATRKLVPDVIAANDADWTTEYLAFVIAIKVVDSIDAAIDHINTYGSHHTDAILSTDAAAIDAFVKRVDSASVMINASTRLADGGEYGLGAEIGISTDKLHARGPMGAADLCTYKWVVTGNGHLR